VPAKRHTYARHFSQTEIENENGHRSAPFHLAGQTHPWRHDWQDLDSYNVIFAFSLIGALAALYMAAHYPLPEAIYAAPITTD
jgi:hypothetical protein